MDEWFKDFYKKNFNTNVPMRVRFLNLSTLGGTIGAFLATLASLISGVNSSQGLVISLFTILFFFVLFILSQLTTKYTLCTLISVCGLNFVIYPLLYFTMGGIKGGMLLYLILGIILSLLTLSYKQTVIIFPLEIIVDVLLFYLGEKFPEMFVTIPCIEDRYIMDNAMDFIVAALTALCIVIALYVSYDKQEKRADDLVDELQELSITDPLTRVRNREFLIQTIDTEIKKTKRTSADLSIIMFDIDNFRLTNEKYGTKVGDEILKSLASVISAQCRDYDTVARYSGDEFMILLPQANVDIAVMRAEEIRKAVEQSELCKNKHIPVTVSGGVAVYNPMTMGSVEDLIFKADYYLNEAKETGRNKIVSKKNSKGLAF